MSNVVYSSEEDFPTFHSYDDEYYDHLYDYEDHGDEEDDELYDPVDYWAD